MFISVVSLFPEMIKHLASFGVLGRAFENQIASLQCLNPRDFATDSNKSVDDRPYGGGPGMLLRTEPYAAAIEAAKERQPSNPVVFLSPQGRLFSQESALQFANGNGITLVCGRYEGFDQRLIEKYADDEISLGDYVLSGGELAALAVIDSVVRLLPNALGSNESASQDSFSSGLLEHPQYTRPEIFDGQAVPSVLINGDHAKIEQWRIKQALGRTWANRPDLLEDRELSDHEKELLQEYVAEYNAR
ncbi:MAG: tRNA (guanosine(37)-N1)-methyltransferase TrmD [Pseudomonadota bacterium]|nr:tRNA (guanosine(37)-N1)-methyltransferase TrmD [Pseudomonadota bacterium]